jgi:hypothetical protein
MNRMIDCETCGQRPIGKYPDEGWKKIWGKAKAPYRCDYCNHVIREGEEAIAVTFFLPGRYRPWENQFIIPTGKEESHG